MTLPVKGHAAELVKTEGVSRHGRRSPRWFCRCTCGWVTEPGNRRWRADIDRRAHVREAGSRQ